MPARRLPSFRPTNLRLRSGRGPAAPDHLEESPAGDEPVSRGRLVDCAIYVDGSRVASPNSLHETYEALGETPAGMAWIGLYRPDTSEMESLAEEFGLHELAIEDAIAAHQRAKLERYGETLFLVLRTARYIDSLEEVEFGEVHIFAGDDFVLTVRHSEAPDLSRVRRRMEDDPELLRLGPEAVIYAILDEVVDGYAPVVEGLENDVEEIEAQVFGGAAGAPAVSRRIYELGREVLEFQRGTRPLTTVMTGLFAGAEKYGVDEELRRYLRDVADHLTVVVERVESLRQLLQNILTVNATLVGQQQNEEMKALTEASFQQNEEVKKISAWAAILFAPTLIGTVYGMNFEGMPELDWEYGYGFAILLMGIVCGSLYYLFHRRNWL